MKPSFKFNKEFGLKLRDRLDGTYYSLLTISVLFFSILVLTLSQLDYHALNNIADQLIRSRYKSLAAEFIIEKVPYQSTNELLLTKPKIADLAQKRKDINKRIERLIQPSDIPGQVASVMGDDLPDVDEYIKNLDELNFGKLSSRYNRWPTAKSNSSRRSVTNYDAGDLEDLLENPFNYLVTRRGAVYINLTDELTSGPQEKKGYRDPIEIERVVETNQPMVEFCFRKEARKNLGLKGFVKVEFRISFEGYVLPESIRIVSSSLRNKKVEKCIKNYIRRWRNFRKLDEEMGIARVIQKFVFN